MPKAKRFDILTIFPGMFGCYLDESMIKRAQARKLLDLRVHDIRDWTTDKHHKVDDRPFGGGPGMLLKVEPIYRALKDLKALKSKAKKRPYVILLSPAALASPTPSAPASPSTTGWCSSAAVTKASTSASPTIWWTRKSPSATTS